MEEEQTIFLRNNDILTTTVRGVTTVVDTKDGNNSTVTFTLDNTKVKNVRSIVVDSTTLTNYADYTVTYNTEATDTTITFDTAPSDNTGNIVITYDHGSRDRIYGDIPRTDIGLTSYPRVSVDYISESTRPFDLGGKTFISNALFEFTVWAESTDDINTMTTNIKTAYIDNVKNFYYVKAMIPQSVGPMLVSADRGGSRGKIHQRNITYEGRFIIERAT